MVLWEYDWGVMGLDSDDEDVVSRLDAAYTILLEGHQGTRN